MSHCRRARVFLLAASLVVSYAAARAAGAEKDYEIRIDRPSKVGDTFGYEATAATRTHTVMTAGGEAPEAEDQSSGVRLSGRVEVLAVSPKGTATKLSCKVESCTSTVGKETKELLPNGAVLVAEWKDGNVWYTRDGQAVDEVTANLLGDVLDVNDPADQSNDDVFGTKQRQKVGAEWPVNLELAGKELAKQGLEVKKENMTGRTRLAEAAEVGGVPCVKVEMSFSGNPIRGKIKDGPEMAVEDGQIKAVLTTVLPQDGKAGPLRETVDLSTRMLMTGKVPVLGDVKLDIKVDQRMERTYTRK